MTTDSFEFRLKEVYYNRTINMYTPSKTCRLNHFLLFILFVLILMQVFGYVFLDWLKIEPLSCGLENRLFCEDYNPNND